MGLVDCTRTLTKRVTWWRAELAGSRAGRDGFRTGSLARVGLTTLEVEQNGVQKTYSPGREACRPTGPTELGGGGGERKEGTCQRIGNLLASLARVEGAAQHSGGDGAAIKGDGHVGGVVREVGRESMIWCVRPFAPLKRAAICRCSRRARPRWVWLSPHFDLALRAPDPWPPVRSLKGVASLRAFDFCPLFCNECLAPSFSFCAADSQSTPTNCSSSVVRATAALSPVLVCLRMRSCRVFVTNYVLSTFRTNAKNRGLQLAARLREQLLSPVISPPCRSADRATMCSL